MNKVNLDQRTKAVLAGGAFLLALSAAVYVIFGSGDEPPAATAPVKTYPDRIPAKDLEKRAASQGPTAPGNKPPTSTVDSGGSVILRMADLTQFDLAESSKDAKTQLEVRNLFIYPPEPPPPPVKPPDPPPVTLHTLNPPNVYAGTDQPIELVVRGTPFEPGYQIVFGGMQLPTNFVGPNELRARVEPGAFSSARPVTVDVRNPASTDPGKQLSTNLSFQINDPPRPDTSFSYIGWTSDRGGANPGAIVAMKGNDSRQVFFVGNVIGDRFRVTKILETTLYLDDTKLSGVRHQMTLQGATGGNTSGGIRQSNAVSDAGSSGQTDYGQYGQPPEQQRIDPATRSFESRVTRVDQNGNPLTPEEIKRRAQESARPVRPAAGKGRN